MSGRDIHGDRILILDFGSQYTQLIARRIREARVYCEIRPYHLSLAEIREFAPNGVILSGGPESVTVDGTLRADPDLFSAGIPVLGICYGMHTMALQMGGRVEPSSKREFGYARVTIRGNSQLLADIADSRQGEERLLDVWMSHGDKVTELPAGFACMAETENTTFAAMYDESRKLYGVQFHPEVTHTHRGQEILGRFVHEVCGCGGLWTAANIIDEIVAETRERVGSDRVILGLSGGVDSSVVAALLHRAIGDQLTCILVDNGLLRKEESGQILQMMGRDTANTFELDIRLVDAADRFLRKLEGVENPETKRKIIGNTFIEVFDEAALTIENARYLAQGTIYPDVIESAGHKGGAAHVIKSHHNVGGLPETMELKLIEPLRELFKDEVRRIGAELGIPDEILYRHPFPGPGLGVRILGEVKREYAEILREVDAIYMEELQAAGLYHQVSQAFAVFLPVKSVGVVGDARRYEYVVALRAVETPDFMTARWAHLPYEFLERVSTRIINEVAEVSRVAYDISSKPPATIEWE